MILSRPGYPFDTTSRILRCLQPENIIVMTVDMMESYFQAPVQGVILAVDKLGFYMRYAEATALWTDNVALKGAAKKDFATKKSPVLCLMLEKVLPFNLVLRYI